MTNATVEEFANWIVELSKRNTEEVRLLSHKSKPTMEDMDLVLKYEGKQELLLEVFTKFTELFKLDKAEEEKAIKN